MRAVAWLAALGVFVAGLAAAAAWAATFRGTARADVIHGTSHADVIYGLGGNDKLYGGAGSDKLYGGPGNDKLYGGSGNDLLVGGPGADLLDCGPGHDIAIADKHDRLIGCEVVKGLRKPKPPPTTTVAAPHVEPGRYCGFTNNGGNICFDITGPPYQFTNAQFDTSFDSHDCTPPARGSVHWTTSGSTPLQADGSFDFVISSGDQAGTEIKGTVDAQGGASGTMHAQSLVVSKGTTYTCTLNATWSTKRQ